MNQENELDFRLRRIMVAVDSSASAQAAVEAAAELAAEFRATLEGLFVEDVNFVHLAALPVGRVVKAPTGEAYEFNHEALEDQFRTEQSRAKQTLENVATRVGVRTSLRIVRGHVAAEIIAAAAGADILILGLSNRPRSRWNRPGSVALAAAERGPRSVLLLHQGARLKRRPFVCYDGSPVAIKALRAAASLARSEEATVCVLIVSDDPDRAKRLRDQVTQQVSQPGLSSEGRWLSSPAERSLRQTPAGSCEDDGSVASSPEPPAALTDGRFSCAQQR